MIGFIDYCRRCECSDLDACVHVDGSPCYWVEDDLCSRCAEGTGMHYLEWMRALHRIARTANSSLTRAESAGSPAVAVLPTTGARGSPRLLTSTVAGFDFSDHTKGVDQ